jgi:ornithine cyclodeaminase/alanine dehydrogenase-like protein (mu-crystallin family)
MLYLTEDDVRRLLPMSECITAMRSTFVHLASGEAINQPRRRLVLPTRSVLHYMAGADGAFYGTKVYSTNLRYGGRFLFLLYRAEDAALLAMMEANYLGQIRTGAASGLAAELLARPDSRILGVIGSGFQARAQVEAIKATMPVNTVRVWSRSEEKRTRFAAECSAQLGIEIEPAASAEEAVRGADIVVTATSSREPVLESGWVAPGTHVNAMGSNQAQRREIPTELVKRANLIAVDSREQSLMEAGDLLLALGPGEWDRVIEFQEVVAGRAGRGRPEDLTLFKSIGLAVEDVAAAAHVYERALAEGAGRQFYS